ncbi:fungal-specific transcription factor domain-containing protein [Aspergillus karnatakaensis]|uniref:transcription factor domain-containing protein n=1 Tax=Aspergillus karnatakaensis TaxID=1810916 RepID=UPI003CCD97EA
METGRRRYMSKAQRACDGCRTRKSACQIDTAPPCRLCRAHGQPCEFTSRSRPRKSPSALSRNDNLHRTASSPGHINHQADVESAVAGFLTTPLALDTPFTSGFGQELDPSPQPDDTMFDDLVLSMYSSYQPSVQAVDPEPVSRSLDNLPDFTAELCGLTGDMDPYVLQHYNFDTNSEFAFSKLTVRQVEKSAVPVQFLLSKQDLTSDARAETDLCLTSEVEDLSSIVPPEIGQRLIRLFYRFIQPQFPILGENSPPAPVESPPDLLAAIYCIAQPFATFDDYLCIELVYTPPSAQTLLSLAWRGVNQAVSHPTISSIQTALILLLRLPTNPLVLDSAWKWALLGMTVSMAQTIGLHLDARRWNLPSSESILRYQLSWLIYTIDKWLAFSFGRPSHIRRDDWLVTEITDSDVLGGSIAVSKFTIEFSKLTTVLDTALSNLYSVRASAALARDFRQTFETARPLLDELAQWAQQILATNSSDASTDFEGLAPLHMAYHAVKILILRALLRPFNHRECYVPDTDRVEWEAARRYIRQAARAEIEAALSRIFSLQVADYQAFWAPWHKTCFALLTHLAFLLAVMSMADRGNATAGEGDSNHVAMRELLDRTRSVLRLHAKGLEVIKFALLRIDAVFWMGWEKVLGLA